MQMPGRTFTAPSSNYRYGFNGKEKDNEVKGEGSQYDYGFRIYDPKIGRFLSVDPLAKLYPWYTPYQFAGNTPIQCIDLDGAEEYHFTMTMDKQGGAVLNKVDVKFVNHHTIWGVKWWPDTKIDVKRYIIDYEGNTYHIGFAQYGKGYSNAWKSEEFENNYIKKQGSAIDFELNYVDDQRSQAVSNVAIVVNTQNVTAEHVIPMAESIAVNPSKIRYSQATISGLDEIQLSMAKNGWKGEPIDIVKMKDGIYTTVDNTRVMAAQNVKIKAQANVHNFDEPISTEMAVRFADKKGNLPKTWGEAVGNRINNQNSSFRSENPNGTFTQPKVNRK